VRLSNCVLRKCSSLKTNSPLSTGGDDSGVIAGEVVSESSEEGRHTASMLGIKPRVYNSYKLLMPPCCFALTHNYYHRTVYSKLLTVATSTLPSRNKTEVTSAASLKFRQSVSGTPPSKQVVVKHADSLRLLWHNRGSTCTILYGIA